MNTHHRVLELYSGIGGMHYAWKESHLNGHVVAAVDINTVANHVYQHNYPDTVIMNRNIQSITADDINKLNVDVILMSPPCQPFTRNGNQKDTEDERNASLSQFLDILKHIHCVRYMLLENVKGFENSLSRHQLIETLTECGFVYREFLLSPKEIGIPNSRLRYYCLAKKVSDVSSLPCDFTIANFPYPHGLEEPVTISKIIGLESKYADEYSIPDKFYRRAQVFDICSPDSRKSCCFTKAYTHFVEGTGSIFTTANQDEIKAAYMQASKYKVDSEEYKTALKSLHMRFFTPREVARLMAFPDTFTFPRDITTKQKYRLLGNSINVKVVSELIKVLIQDTKADI